jgi:hypothetical protein
MFPMVILFPLLMMAGTLVFGVFMLSLAVRQSERSHQNVIQLAHRLRLTPAQVTKRFGFWPQPHATGSIRGKAARLYPFTTGSGKSRVRWTALAVHPAATGGLTFHLGRQGFGTKFAQLFGAREITVGDPAFDAAWFIQTNQPEFLRAALIPELRARITSAFDQSGRAHRISLKLESDAVVYAEAGDFGDERRCERIARMADVLADLADVAEVFAKMGSKP